MDRRKFTSVITGLTAAAALGDVNSALEDIKPKYAHNRAKANILHTGISTMDIERSIRFYQNMLGMALTIPIREFRGEVYDIMFQYKGAYGKAATLSLGNINIELFEFENPKPKQRQDMRPAFEPGIYHICFQVSDAQKEYERIRDAGVYFHAPPYRVDGEGLVTYGRDPDGNIFELLELF